MATRYLRTRPEWADALRSGRKTLDARSVTYEIDGLKAGDVVQYPGVRARVVRLRFYLGFGNLLAYEDWRQIAPDATGRDEVHRLLAEGHQATGAVAIELECLGTEEWGGGLNLLDQALSVSGRGGVPARERAPFHRDRGRVSHRKGNQRLRRPSSGPMIDDDISPF
jgi:ASC-1-like (ASCH) protein